MEADHFHKIGWLCNIRSLLISMGMPSLWDDPSATGFPPKHLIKQKYWEPMVQEANRMSDATSLTGKF